MRKIFYLCKDKEKMEHPFCSSSAKKGGLKTPENESAGDMLRNVVL